MGQLFHFFLVEFDAFNVSDEESEDSLLIKHLIYLLLVHKAIILINIIMCLIHMYKCI